MLIIYWRNIYKEKNIPTYPTSVCFPLFPHGGPEDVGILRSPQTTQKSPQLGTVHSSTPLLYIFYCTRVNTPSAPQQQHTGLTYWQRDLFWQECMWFITVHNNTWPVSCVSHNRKSKAPLQRAPVKPLYLITCLAVSIIALPQTHTVSHTIERVAMCSPSDLTGRNFNIKVSYARDSRNFRFDCTCFCSFENL